MIFERATHWLDGETDKRQSSVQVATAEKALKTYKSHCTQSAAFPIIKMHPWCKDPTLHALAHSGPKSAPVQC